MPTGPGPQLSRRVLAAYAGPCLPLAALGLPLVVYLPEFYARYIGVPLSVVGAIFMALRLGDLGVDPVLGVWMDRTATRFGRFRPWVVAGTPLVLAATAALFLARPGVGAAYLAGWLALMYVGYSLAVLGHTAWGSRLSGQYHERSRIYAWWQGANVLGMILVLVTAAAAPAVLKGDPAASVRAMGGFCLALLPVTVAGLALGVPEGRAAAAEAGRAGAQTRSGLGPYIALLKRPAILRVLIADLAFSLCGGVTGTLFLFLFRDARGFSGAQANVLLLVYFIGGLVGAPVWTRMARRFGKHGALMIAAGYVVPSQIGILLLPTDMRLALPALFVAGLAYAASGLLIRSMVADAGDEHRLQTGEDRAAVLYALVNATSKAGFALAVGLAFPLLDLFGFVARAGRANTPAALQAVEALFVALPIGFALMGAAAMIGYRLNAVRHDEVRRALEVRDGAAAVGAEPKPEPEPEPESEPEPPSPLASPLTPAIPAP